MSQNVVNPPPNVRPPAPLGDRPVVGQYTITGVFVDAHMAHSHGSSMVQFDSFDNIGGARPVQLPDIHLRDTYSVTERGIRDPGYNQDFRIPADDAQRQAIRGLQAIILGSGLLDLPRAQLVGNRAPGHSDPDRGMVGITVAGRDSRGPRVDTFAAQISGAPQPILDVLRAAQQLGDDLHRNGVIPPE